jgi:hypothetical protein
MNWFFVIFYHESDMDFFLRFYMNHSFGLKENFNVRVLKVSVTYPDIYIKKFFTVYGIIQKICPSLCFAENSLYEILKIDRKFSYL